MIAGNMAMFARAPWELLPLMVVNAEGRFAEGRVNQSYLVYGSAVISNDYFKRLLAILRNFFGFLSAWPFLDWMACNLSIWRVLLRTLACIDQSAIIAVTASLLP